MKYQTVLYEARKGMVAWKLSAEFLAQLKTAFKTLKEPAEGDTKLPYIAVPIGDVKKSIETKTPIKANGESLASQIQRKHRDLKAVSVGENILFRPKASEPLAELGG